MFFLNRLVIKMIKSYQKKDLPHRCRHIPSCSCYGLECFEKFNFLKASFLTTYRIIRCNPLSWKIYDPVPLSKKEKKEKKILFKERSKFDDSFFKQDLASNIIMLWENSFGMVEYNDFSKITNNEMTIFLTNIEYLAFYIKKNQPKKTYKQSKKYLKQYLFSDIRYHPHLFINNYNQKSSL